MSTSLVRSYNTFKTYIIKKDVEQKRKLICFVSASLCFSNNQTTLKFLKNVFVNAWNFACWKRSDPLFEKQFEQTSRDFPGKKCSTLFLFCFFPKIVCKQEPWSLFDRFFCIKQIGLVYLCFYNWFCTSACDHACWWS